MRADLREQIAVVASMPLPHATIDRQERGAGAHGTRIRGSVAAAVGGHQAVQLSGSWRARWPDPATERLAPGAQTPWRGGATPVVTSLSARGVRLPGS